MDHRFFTIGSALLASMVLLAGGQPVARGDEASPPGDVTTTRLLDALEERQMPDVVLWVLERVDADKNAGPALKKEVPYRRAAALVAVSRSETDQKRKADSLDRAQREIESFLASKPAIDRVIAASMQKGNLLVERGRAKVEQSKRPGEDAKKIRAEAVPFFDQAIKTLEGKPRKPDDPIADDSTAEDAVLMALRDVGDKLKSFGGAEPAAKDAKAAKRAPVSRADRRQIEELEEQQVALRGQLLQVRLLVAAVYFEKSKALEPKSNEWAEALKTSAKKYADLYAKYPKLGAGLFARYYEGRNYTELGDYAKALTTLADVRSLEGEAGFVPLLRSKAMNSSLQCWLADEKADLAFPDFSDDLLKAALAPMPGNLSAADMDDWLAMKYRAAALLERRAAAIPDNEKGRKAPLLRDTRKLAMEVAKANRDFAAESRELLAKLGKDVGEAQVVATFETVMDEAKMSLATMQAKQAEAKQTQGEAAATAVKAAAEARDQTIAAVSKAIALGSDNDLAALNQARYLLTFLMYDAKRLHEAATLGAFLADRYPNARGSRQAATIAMASWQQLQKQEVPEWAADAKAKCGDVAGLILRTWPDQPESADAAVVAIAAAVEARNPAQIISILEKLPAESPRRADVLLRAGAALYREVQESRRLEEGVRPPENEIAAWRQQAATAIDEGLSLVPKGAAPSKVAVAAALARCQMAMEDDAPKTVAEILANPDYGPWSVLQKSDPQFAEGALAEGTLSLALRHFIDTDQVDKAEEAMTKLEALAGTGDEASAKLTAMYLGMGRDLQSQLEALGSGDNAGSPASQSRADAILAGFEKFLDRVEKRDDKISSQMWVASTYLTLGSGKGTGAVVSKAKASGYLGKAAEVFEKLLAKGGEEIVKFEPAIRLKMANIYREREKWDEAQGHLDWILADARRQNMLDAQIQAAELLQAAGENIDDKEKAAEFLKEAIAGRKAGNAVIWGWGGISNKLVRQAFAGSDEKALKAQAQFFDARLNVAKCRLTRAELPGQDRDQLLQMAENDIAITYKLYPGLGGEASKKRFDKLLREVQKARNVEAKGLAAIDEAAAAAAAGG